VQLGCAPRKDAFVRIPNTLHLEHVYVSENLMDEALRHEGAEVVGGPEELRFGPEGDLEAF